MTMPGFLNQDDLISEIFGQRPELAFLGRVGQSGLDQNAQELFRGRTSDFMRRFQQALGQQLTAGQLPTLRPEEFFGGLDLQQEQFRFSPEQRGLSTRGLVGPTRFFF